MRYKPDVDKIIIFSLQNLSFKFSVTVKIVMMRMDRLYQAWCKLETCPDKLEARCHFWGSNLLRVKCKFKLLFGILNPIKKIILCQNFPFDSTYKCSAITVERLVKYKLYGHLCENRDKIMIHIFLEKPFKQTFISKMFIKSAYLSNNQQLPTNTISIILLKLQHVYSTSS